MEGAYKISCEPKLLRKRFFFFNEQPFWNSQLFIPKTLENVITV